MSKISIEEVESVLVQNKVEQAKVAAIIKDLEEIVVELKEDKDSEKLPKVKWEHIIILSDNSGELKSREFVGWVVVQKEGDDAATILSRLSDAAKSQNEVTKKKKNIISGFNSLFELLKSKFLKEKNLKIKTKEPVRVLVTSDKLV